MPHWVHDKEAVYVLAAYSMAFLGLLGFLLFSWKNLLTRRTEWERLQKQKVHN